MSEDRNLERDLSVSKCASKAIRTHTVANGRRWRYGYIVQIDQGEVLVFRTAEDQYAYMNAVYSAKSDSEIDFWDDPDFIDLGPAIRGVDYGPGSIRRKCTGHVPRCAYQKRGSQ